MRKLAVTLFAAGVLALTGCASQDDTIELHDSAERAVGSVEYGTSSTEMPNGREASCIWTKKGYSGGLQCDFTD